MTNPPPHVSADGSTVIEFREGIATVTTNRAAEALENRRLNSLVTASVLCGLLPFSLVCPDDFANAVPVPRRARAERRYGTIRNAPRPRRNDHCARCGRKVKRCACPR